MFGTVLIKEIQENLLSSRFLIALLLCITLIPLGTYVNLKVYKQRLLDYQEAERLYRERSEGSINMDFQAEGYRPPSILSIFSVGLEFFFPNKITTSRDGNLVLSNATTVDNPPSFLFGKIDFLFNVAFVLSLFALIFTFNLISGEKETGTLRLSLSNSIPRWQILLGKLVGSFTILVIPFLISIFISIIILLLSAEVPIFSRQIFLSIIVIIISASLLILCMFSLGILISTLTHRSINSIVVLLFVWTMLVLILPKLSPMIAELIHPIKSQQVINLEKMLIKTNLEKELDRERRKLFDKITSEFGLPDRLSVPGRTDAERNAQSYFDQEKIIIEQRYRERINSEIDKLEQQYSNDRNSQTAIAMNLSRVSPVSCYSYIVSEIAATGMLEMNNLAEHAKRFQNRVKEEIYDKYIIKSYGGTDGGSATMINYAKGFDPKEAPVPQLNYAHVSFTETLPYIWIDLMLLILYNIVFFAAAYVAFLRYDVR